MPQDEHSKAEMSEILAVKENLINYSSSTPIPKIYFDALTGGYILTKEKRKIPKELFLNIVMIFDFDVIFRKFEDIQRLKYDGKEPEEYDGHDLFSFLLPFDFVYSLGGITIYQGVLLKGTLTDKCLGQKSNSIIVYLNKNYSSKVALDFVTNYQKVMNDWLAETGFSVGIGDCVIKEMKGLDEIISTSVIKADSKGKKDQQVSDYLDNSFNLASELVKESVKDNKDNNALVSMIMSGAKGKIENLTQITAMIGRQDKEGRLITEGFNDRTLPCYRRRKTEEKASFDCKRSLRDIQLKAESQGFIRNSFMSGTTPREFWFHASSGRDGIISTAIRTADVGYLTRSLSKYLEDVKTNNIGQVVNQIEQVVSFHFGFDSSIGIDTSKCIIIHGQPQFADVKSLVDKIQGE